MNNGRMSQFSFRLSGIVLMFSMVFLNLGTLGDVIVAHAQEPMPFAPPAAQVESIILLDPNPTNLASLNFSVVFTKEVISVDAADFALTTTGDITGASVSAVSGTKDTYTVTVNTGTGSGTLRLDVPASATITDKKGTPIVGLPYTGGAAYDVDKTPPSVSITSTANDPTNVNPIPVTITFSEDVTGFVIEDISVGNNGRTSNFSGSGTTYTVDVTPDADGAVTVDVAAAAAQDAAGNDSTAASQFSITYDSTAPTVVSITRANPNPTYAASVDFAVTFSEDVIDVDSADFSLATTGDVTGASVSAVSGSTNTYTVTVATGSGSGTIRLDLPASAAITDLSTNALAGLPYTAGEDYTIPLLPTPKKPTGDISDTTPKYAWTVVDGAELYHFQLNQGSTFVYNQYATVGYCGATYCGKTPPTALALNDYQWQIRAKAGGVWGTWSDLLPFTVTEDPIPKKPSGDISDTTPKYAWTKAAGATLYHFQLFKGAALIYDQYATDGYCGPDYCGKTPPTVLDYADYQWKVRAQIGGLWEDWSNYLPFTVNP